MDFKQLGPYKLKRRIGQGGMGTVFEAVHTETDEVVAVKSLATVRSSDAKFRKRFESEINTLIELNHPNIVRILSHGQDQGHLYFAMQLVEGESLYDRLKKLGALSWAETVAYAQDICEGLRHAHDRGFIHRDLKPSNLLLDKKGRVLITDFGIARDSTVLGHHFEEQVTSPGGIVGTLDYMSPEQVNGQTATVRSDIYSLGCVFYALLAGRPPFAFRSVGEAQKTIGQTDPTSISLLVPQLPAPLARIIMRMLEADPAKRHGTALAISKRLNEFMEEQSLKMKVEETLEVLDDDDNEYALQEEPDLHVQKTEITHPKDGGQTTLATGGQPSVADQPGKDDATLLARPTATAHEDAWGAAPKKDYFSNVSPDDPPKRSWDLPTESTGPVWPYVIGLSSILVLLMGALFWALTRQPTADQLYEQITQSIESGNNPTIVEDEMNLFLQQYPDDERVVTVERQLDAIAAKRLPRKLSRILQFGGTGQLNDAQREFLGALRVSETDPQNGLRFMVALVGVYGDSVDPETLACVESAEQQITWLMEVVAKQTEDRKAVIAEALARFEQQPAPSSTTIRDMCESLIVLYGNDPTVRAAMEPIREKLETLESGESASPSGSEN